MTADQIMWATIFCRKAGIEFAESRWQRLSQNSGIFCMRIGWTLIALDASGKRVAADED
jgi:hypothetical protein